MVGGVLFRVYIPTSRYEKYVRGLARYKNNESSESIQRRSKTDEDTKSTSSVGSGEATEFKTENEISKSGEHVLTAAKRITAAGNELSPPEDATMEEILRKVLEGMDIMTAMWSSGEDHNHYQVLFSMEAGPACDEILRQLTERGVGSKMHSVISMTPCSLHYQGLKGRSTSDEKVIEDDERNEKAEEKSNSTEWSKFLSSVRARLTVAQVVQEVRADAYLTFDFLSLLLIAAFLAALGLVEDNTEILVASMLISPLMGPILAGTLGTMIGDKHLQKMGIRNEMFGLLICLIMGYIFGFVIGLATDHWGEGEWPTHQMTSRGQVHSIWVGILVALFSGAAVAIAILGDYTGSLVGVAISTALLPPAVNAGLLWSLACTELLKENYWFTNRTLLEQNTSFIYEGYPPAELAVLGSISVCLTLINIICIFLAGTVVLKIKAVAPRTSKEQHQFWSHDIKVARDYSQAYDDQEADRTRLREELPGFPGADSQSRYKRRGRSFIQSNQEFVTSSLLHSGVSQFTWSPGSRVFMHDDQTTFRELENLCFSVSGGGRRRNSPFSHRIYPLPEAWFPGSSGPRTAPQKKNLDVVEVVRTLPAIPESQSSLGESSSASSNSSGRSRFVVTRSDDAASQ